MNTLPGLPNETIYQEQLGDWLKNLGSELEKIDFREPLGFLASELIQETRRHAESGVDPDATPWLPRRKDKAMPHLAPLLSRFVADVQSHSLMYGTTNFIGRLAHHGDKRQFHRPMIGFSESFIKKADEVLGDFVANRIAATPVKT